MDSPGVPAGASTAVKVTEASQVGEVRRTVAAVCTSVGLDETEGGRAAIIATEAATNILKHARGGEVVVTPLARPGPVGVELLVLDRGPGIADIEASLSDGHSTTGSRGTGLGAMRRQSSLFEVFTQPGRGTAILSRIWHGEAPASAIELGALCVAKPGETECGDVWIFEPRRGGGRIVVADGLGHGPLARDAALAAVGATAGRLGGPSRVLEDAHAAARSTRGAAVAVVEVDLPAGKVGFAGLGNATGALVDPERVQNMVSMNGTAGQGTFKAREFTYSFSPGALLIVCSDGLATHWSLEQYPGLARRHPSLVAGVLYRDHSRRRDDVTVVVARLGKSA
jgi:anti-sigma regulatory factor (Ser/Thr protein kinase)